MPDLAKLCTQHGLKMCSVAQIIEHRLARESLVRRVGPASVLLPGSLPLWTTLLAIWVLHERVTAVRALCLALILLGAAVPMLADELRGLGRRAVVVGCEASKPASIEAMFARAERELGYRPTVALRDGMRASIEWCLANGHQI